MLISLDNKLLQQAHIPFSCRRVDFADAASLITGTYRPQSGDLVLAKIKNVRQHKRIELASGRKPELAEGDLVVLAYGNRYAPDQFEGLIPEHIGECDMVAAGGVAAVEVERNQKISGATNITPLGVLADGQGRALNLMRYRVEDPQSNLELPPVFVVCGTSMNAGKTHTAASLIRGLSQTGLKVGATKVTGTGAGGDIWRMRDSGAFRVLDFTDAGFATTYLNSNTQLIETTTLLTHVLVAEGAEAIVVEIADGLSHGETREILQSPELQDMVSGVLFAAGDAMSAAYGELWLRQWGLPLIAISGLVSISPLACRELCRLVDTPVLTANQLATPEQLLPIMGHLLALSQTEETPRYGNAASFASPLFSKEPGAGEFLNKLARSA